MLVKKMKNNQARKMKLFVCEECREEFVARADHEQRFCSRQCAGKHLSKTKRKYEICPICGKEFVKARGSKMYCSSECYNIARQKKTELICLACGKHFERVNCHIGEHNFCSKECVNKWNRENRKGENANGWKGGIHYQDGYIFKKEKDGGYRGEHRILMEEKLGRRLTEQEVVHHIDGNKTNNSLDNLMVMTRAEHALLHRPADKKIKKNNA